MRIDAQPGHRVAIIGGGFAGLSAAQSLAASYQVTLFDPNSDFEFLPNIHELLSGRTRPQALRLPRSELLSRHGHRFVQARVTELSLSQRELVTESAQSYPWDFCVVATGAASQTAGVTGAKEHAVALRSLADAGQIVWRLSQLPPPPHPRRLVIVGGGLEGIEVLGELLRGLRGTKDWQIDLVEAGPRLLMEAPAALERAIREHCASSAVHFHVGTRVEQVHADCVVLQTGARLASELTIWTAGSKASALLFAAGLSDGPGKWARVNASLQPLGHDNVFVTGDTAALPKALAKQAYHAMKMGRLAAENIDRLVRGLAPRAFVADSRPTVISFGDLDTFVVFEQTALAGLSLSVLKEGILETTMARLDTRRDVKSLVRLVRRAKGGLDGLLRTFRDAPTSLSRLGGVRVL